jgi:glycosyltransferase involved in cell wall biosynthesis
MNIWIFNQYAHPPDLPVGTRHYDLGRELVKRGHRVVIFATSFHHYLHRETRLRPGEKWKVENVDGVKFVWIRTPPYWRNDWRRVRNMVIFALRAWWLGRKLTKLVPEIGKPDVVIGSSPHLLTPLAAYWVARHHRVPFVMEVRDLWPQTIIDMGELSTHHPITKALQTLERFLYHRAEKIISLLAQADKYITACGIPQEKIVWIPNGVDLSRFEGLEHCVTSENGLKVIYLGAHGKANALDTVIQAAKILQDWGYREICFILIGDGAEKPKLMALAKELGLLNVEFRDPVPKSEVAKVLHEADAFFVQLGGTEVYRYGISSNKLFDFMAAGKPVFSSAAAPKNPVEEAGCGFTIPPQNPQALAEAVIKLYQMSPEERAEMGKRGREYVEKHHDIRKLAAQLESVLQSVLSGE